MRLNLIIQRHGLPIVRILWNTSQSSSLGPSSVGPFGLLASRTQNVAYGTGGYTVAQLLEDINDVVPLETADTSVGLNDELCGQWGLEDYVVEDGDEVVVRALQTVDLRARRLSGRHQISWNGRHLIDGVPFGRPYLKRSSSSRPAIKIPPRKRRCTTFSGWQASPHKEEEDAEQENSEDDFNSRELTLYSNGYVDSDQDTVIRHQKNDYDDDVQGSESDVDASDWKDEDFTEEIKDLKEDLSNAKLLGMTNPDVPRPTRNSERLSGLSRHPTTQTKPSGIHKAQSLSPVSQPRSDSVDSAGKANHSPRSLKNVRFLKEPQQETSSSTSTSSSSDEELDSGESGSVSLSSSDGSETSSDSSETSSVVSDSESNAEVTPKPDVKVGPPGQGSPRTKNSNRRTKLRRRLTKLKELGHLPPDADFATLRAWEAANGGGHPLAELTDVTESRSPQAREQSEFEVRRQKLLQDLESGGVDIDAHSEKENIPPQYRKDSVSPPAEKSATGGDTEPATELTADSIHEKQPGVSRKPTVDVGSSRRLLFGSLGVKAPKTKEDEEATRQRLAGQSNQSQFNSQNRTEDLADQPHHDIEENWPDKLVVNAAECFLDDIKLSTPPFPFKQRWDTEAQAVVRQLKGSGHNRKKRPRVSQDDESSGFDADHKNDNTKLNYDDRQPSAQACHDRNDDNRKKRPRVSQDDESSGFDADHKNDNTELNYDDHQPSPQAYREVNDDDGEKRPRVSQDDESSGLDADYKNDNTELNYDDHQPSPQACREGNDDVQEHQSCEMDATLMGDLPLVPEVLTRVPDLVEDEMRKGAIIAYKQLELSKSTNWQPTVSGYQVAVVECLLDSGSARVRLAKRHWNQARPNSNKSEGSRQYSGLEMPEFDDEELEDDGFREVLFGDLIEPKLIQISERADPAEVDEDGMNASLEDAIVDDYDMISLPDPPQPVNTEITISPQTRNDISQIIHDAGFRSTIDSELLEPDFPLLEEHYQNDSRVELEAQGSDASSVVRPPTFAEFPSSPPDIGHSPQKSSGPRSPTSTAHSDIDQRTALQDDAISFSYRDKITTRQKSEDSHQSPTSIHDDADVETRSDKIIETGDSRSKSPSVVTHIDEHPETGLTHSPLLDQTGSFMERPLSPVSVSPNQEYQEVHSPASSMVPNPFFEKDNCDKGQTFPDQPLQDFVDVDWIIDEEPVTDLPSLESIFALNAPPATDLESTTQVSKRQRKSLSSPRQPPSCPPQVPNDHSSPRLPAPRQSPEPAMPDTSQIVDLTVSSPPRSPSGSDKDFAKTEGLPQGPGWVQKSVPARKMRTRSSTNGPGLGETGSPPRRGRGGRGKISKNLS
ncbi:hypothetical protein Egran_00313 [Elaphomyces granulatus]|uniref:Uncharacterized protein n=1 Tax=Elaphomyces granulatus TaxID=519963 RepID=A0A232M6B6_9EURO|nr:hypothetical protein Egran_00313 [Elaphomyces granulatus]